MHPTGSCFITLTYDDKHLPFDGSLRKSDFQGFMKRLRERIAADATQFDASIKIKYFHCGEYGSAENTWRPHYHAVLFGINFQDRRVVEYKRHKKSRENYPVYSSYELADIWGEGNVAVDDLTPQNAGYTAGYVMKKVVGKDEDSHYLRPAPDFETTGEMYPVLPEYTTMSQGIGKSWLSKYYTDVFPHGHVITHDKKQQKVPRYYEKLAEQFGDTEMLESIKEERQLIAQAKQQADLKYSTHTKEERDVVREEILTKRATKLVQRI